MHLDEDQCARFAQELTERGLDDPGLDKIAVADIAGELLVPVVKDAWPIRAASNGGRRHTLAPGTVFASSQRSVSLNLIRHKGGFADNGTPMFGYVGGVSYATINGVRYLFDGHHNWLVCLLAGADLDAWEHTANVGVMLTPPRFRARGRDII